MRKFYNGPAGRPDRRLSDRRSSRLYGSELNWRGVYVADKPDDADVDHGGAGGAALLALRRRARISNAELQFTTATLDALRLRHPLFDTTNPTFPPLPQPGALIIWYGLADPHIAPANSVALHQAMGRQLGAPRACATLSGFTCCPASAIAAAARGGQSGPADADDGLGRNRHLRPGDPDL